MVTLGTADAPGVVPVSVAVCARDAEKTIGRCLRSIVANHPAEIIVVADRSVDRTAEVASEYAHKLYQTGLGVSHARQLAAENASQEYIAYVDADVTIPPDTLARLLSELLAHGYSGIRAKIEAGSIGNYWEWAEDQHFALCRNTEGSANIIGTRATLFHRQAIIREPFDPLFESMEDVDLSLRLRRIGLTLGISSATAYHWHRPSLASVVRQRIWYGRGCARLAWKHKSPTLLANAVPVPIHGAWRATRSKRFGLLPFYAVVKVAQCVGFWTGLAQMVLQHFFTSGPQSRAGKKGGRR
jgi:glycosyltransferase involved in cell wall biosynthesis